MAVLAWGLAEARTVKGGAMSEDDLPDEMDLLEACSDPDEFKLMERLLDTLEESDFLRLRDLALKTVSRSKWAELAMAHIDEVWIEDLVDGLVATEPENRAIAKQGTCLHATQSEWYQFRRIVVETAPVQVLFEVVLERGSEASIYEDEAGDEWRQKEIENLRAAGVSTTAFHLASMINLAPDQDAWRRTVDLLAQLNTDGLLKGREPEHDESTAKSVERPPQRYLVEKTDFGYLPNSIKKEMPKHIKEVVAVEDRFTHVPTLEIRDKLRSLKTRFPHCNRLIDGVAEALEQNWHLGSDVVSFRPTLLVGPPGVGKTKVAREVCKALGLYYQEANVGGTTESHLFGLSAGWSSAHAGIVTEAVASSRVLNPCIILDEIDKVHAGKNGDIQGELLGLLERDEARRYFERYLKATVDASHVNWILTANELGSVSGPLRSRCTIYKIPEPTREQIPAIIRSLVADFAGANGLRTEFFQLTVAEVEALATVYENRRCLRTLNRAVQRYLQEKNRTLRRV